ncbi:MAG: hypothetical protein AB1698_20405 [Pseudomonadota bacterium]
MSDALPQGWIHIRHLDTTPDLKIMRPRLAPPRGWKPVAEILVRRADGDGWCWLIQHNSGRYAILSPRGPTLSVDQRRVKMALAKEGLLGEAPAAPIEAADLAQQLKTWRRGGVADGPYLLTVAEASRVLGIPRRTLENIEQGRGFPYALLLSQALAQFGEAAPVGEDVQEGA